MKKHLKLYNMSTESTSVKNGQKDGLSLQITDWNRLPAGNTTFNGPYLLKNITDNNITLNVKTALGNDRVLVLLPGWNPEFVTAVTSAPANSIEYGY